MGRLNCKYLAVRMLSLEDFEKVRKYVRERDCNAIGIKCKKIFVLSNRNGIMFRFNNGVETFKKHLGLRNVPQRVTAINQNVDILGDVVKKNSKLFHKRGGVETFGDWTYAFCVNKYLCNSSKEYEVKKNNSIIAKEGALGAVYRNAMDYCTALKQEQAFKQLQQDTEVASLCKRDLPNGKCIEAKFAPYGQYENTAQGRLEAEKHGHTVLIESHLGDGTSENPLCNRRKHYVIYSESSGWGKSTFANFLVKNYNAQRINQLNNFCGIRDNIQFLVLDEYGGGFSDENLKLITSGDASGFTGNRKSHGKGWSPRPDLQLIFLMNKCLFAYHGHYDSKLQRRVIDQSLRDTFTQRFIHIKLDSTPIHDENVDVILHCNPAILSNEEKIKYFIYEYYTCCTTKKEKRMENIKFCCQFDKNLFLELSDSAKHEENTDKIKFVKRVQRVLAEKSKPMIKMYLYYLRGYINENLSAYIDLSEHDLDHMLSIIDNLVFDCS